MATAAGKTRKSFNLSDEAIDALSSAASVEQRQELDILETMILHQCPPVQPITDLDQLALDVATIKEDLKAFAGLFERFIADHGASSKTTEPAPAPEPTPKEALNTFIASNRALYQQPTTPADSHAGYVDDPPKGWVRRVLSAAIYTNKKGF